MNENEAVNTGQLDLIEIKEKAEREAFKKVSATLLKSTRIEKIVMTILCVVLVILSVQVAGLSKVYSENAKDMLQKAEKNKQRNYQALAVLKQIRDYLQESMPTKLEEE